jgi:hypothetical protein
MILTASPNSKAQRNHRHWQMDRLSFDLIAFISSLSFHHSLLYISSSTIIPLYYSLNDGSKQSQSIGKVHRHGQATHSKNGMLFVDREYRHEQSLEEFGGLNFGSKR